MLASASLTACVSTEMGGQATGMGPRYPTRQPPASAKSAPRASAPARPGAQAQGTYKVGKPYQVKGVWYTPREDPDYDELGIASWYGDAFHLRATASGEPFDMYMPSAAHKTLPLQSVVEVTNLENGRRIQVRINDRGPFVDGRIIDLSRAAAEDLGMLRTGVARVRVRYVGIAGAKPQPPIVVASNRRRESAAPALETSRAAFDPRELDRAPAEPVRYEATPLSALY
jgi:rare lipoprotein A